MSAREEAGDPISAHVWRTSAVVVIGSIMSILDTTIVNVALDTLSRELHSTIAEIQWVVTGYMLALAAVIPVSGWAARRFGAKQVYLVSVVLFTAGSALCGLATSTTELILFRVLQGVGGGMILPVGQLMMAEAAGPKRMGRVMSVVAVPAMLAPILGPTIGGLIIQNTSWRWIFYVNVPIGVIAVATALRYRPWLKPEKADKLDVRGLILMATGLPLLTYGLAEIGVTGSFTSVKVVVPIILGIALVAAFVLHALKIPKPSDRSSCRRSASRRLPRSPGERLRARCRRRSRDERPASTAAAGSSRRTARRRGRTSRTRPTRTSAVGIAACRAVS